jgi:transcription elongation factor Elf1
MAESPPVDWRFSCLRCKEWKREADVKVLRVLKNGTDIYVFKCPDCRTEQMAIRVDPSVVGEANV